MSVKVTTLDKLSVLESLYRRGYQSDVIDLTIQGFVVVIFKTNNTKQRKGSAEYG